MSIKMKFIYNNMQGVYKNIEQYNLSIKCNLLVFNDMMLI